MSQIQWPHINDNATEIVLEKMYTHVQLARFYNLCKSNVQKYKVFILGVK